MSRPISAMIAWAPSGPIPVISSSRAAAGRTGVPGPVALPAPVPWAAGMAAISCSIREVSLPEGGPVMPGV